MLKLILRDIWRSPNHSSKKKDDDTHDIKKEILKRVGIKKYGWKVGKNPDIDVNPTTEKIELKSKKNKNIYETDINADEHFIYVGKDKSFVIHFLTDNDVTYDRFKSMINNIDKHYVIPPDNTVIYGIIDYLIGHYADQDITVLVEINEI